LYSLSTPRHVVDVNHPYVVHEGKDHTLCLAG
jgi:hypothetical protein